jgi:hypothetical protein
MPRFIEKLQSRLSAALAGSDILRTAVAPLCDLRCSGSSMGLLLLGVYEHGCCKTIDERYARFRF